VAARDRDPNLHLPCSWKFCKSLPKYNNLLENIKFHVSFEEIQAVPTIADYRETLRFN
jgi:hypothetical protein